MYSFHSFRCSFGHHSRKMPSRYISGENEEKEKVTMTVPVLTEMRRDGKRMDQKMCFYLGGKHQVNPPTPTDPDVKIYKPDKEVTVYVHTFGGFATQDTKLKQAKKFADLLSSTGKEVDKDHFYTASYDAPVKFTNRTNEVMFRVQSNSYDMSGQMDG